jgi:uncharacterized repeat protein (TIGR03803 family)
MTSARHRPTLWALAVLASAPVAIPARAASYSVLYSFQGGTDGAYPVASLIEMSGKLYGTTTYGGNSRCGYGADVGCGTVFSITPSGKEKVVYVFKGDRDGFYPDSHLVALYGTLYGTTSAGGRGAGTFFSLTPSGVKTVLCRFDNTKGELPTGLNVIGGALYGTTSRGGAAGYGTVFTITPAGKEKVLYSFQGGRDGYYPSSQLMQRGGALYGTTQTGGSSGNGTVFRLTPSGEHTVLYSFKGGSDGANPSGGIVDVAGSFYGATAAGGDGGLCGFMGTPCGTVFSLTRSGSERVLHAFTGGADGGSPYAPLINVGGTLFGTTLENVFEISTAGAEISLHDFTGGSDGSNAESALLNVHGTLYGTTAFGGGTGCVDGFGCGTVYKVEP